MYKAFERLCLMIWMTFYIASLSAIGMSLVVILMYEMIRYTGSPMPPNQPTEFMDQMGRLMLFGIAMLPIAIFFHLLGLRFLHFEQHEDTLDKQVEIGPMWADEEETEKNQEQDES